MREPSYNNKRNIRITFLIISLLLSLFAYKHYPSFISYILWAIAFICILTLLVSPLTLKPLYLLWLRITHAIGRFNTMVLLGVVFYIVFIPTGLVMRFLHKDPMKRRQKKTGSYWEPYRQAGLANKSQYEKQF